MSTDMKRRVLERGFPEDKVEVLPVSIDVETYPFSLRTLARDERVELISVARFVEKKGLDDLLNALSLVKARTSKPFHCSIVGDGPLEADLRALRSTLALEDTVEFLGSLPVEDVIDRFPAMHLMVQPSKTAHDGDME
jgi:colanic acid/amylovoran biosynthesis glycosyltransferase